MPEVEVLAGREGFLFMRGDSNSVLAQHTGALQPGRAWEHGWRDLLERRHRRLEGLGLPWVGLVAPDKEAVYPEMLPAGIEPAPRRPVHAFLEAAEAVGAPVGYALDAVRAGKHEGLAYFKSDTHWSGRGAYSAYREYCDLILRAGLELDALEPDEIEWRRLNVEGDLGSKLAPPQKALTIVARIRTPKARLISDNRVLNHGRLIRFRKQRTSGPAAVIFGESFTYNLLPFLKESFARLTFAHSSVFDYRLLRRERPDIVLWCPVERFLINVPSDRGGSGRLRLERASKRLRRQRARPGGHFLS